MRKWNSRGEGWERVSLSNQSSSTCLDRPFRSLSLMISPAKYLSSLIAQRAVRVPPYPEVAVRIQGLLDSPKFSLAEISKLVSSDGALAIRVLGLANSSVYRPLAGPLHSVDAAVGRLGASQVAQSALSAALADGCCKDGPLLHFRFVAWRRSLTAAFITQELAALRGVKPGEAFLSGLLRDYGISVGYANLEVAIRRGLIADDLPAAAYREAVEGLQRELGRVVAARWQLPERYRAALEDVGAGSDPQALALMASQARRVAAFVDSYPCVTERLLVAALSNAEERRAILRFIPRLPELLASLGPGEFSPEGPARVLRSAPLSSLAPESRSAPNWEVPEHSSGRSLGASYPVEVRRSTAKLEGEFVPETETSGQLIVPCAFATGWLAELSLFEAGERLIFWVKVEASVPLGNSHRLQVTAFGLDDVSSLRLRLLASRLRATA